MAARSFLGNQIPFINAGWVYRVLRRIFGVLQLCLTVLAAYFFLFFFDAISASASSIPRMSSRRFPLPSSSTTRQLHFVTFSCYHRAPLLADPHRRDLFVEILEQVRCGF